MVLGVVCEYNPFHNGHSYQLARSREAAGEGAVAVCVMSGDFVQRGGAAVYTKFARAEAACRCGADLVVELPLPWCLSSAEGFARGAVGLLGALGAERLCYGTEAGTDRELDALAALLLDPAFLDRVKRSMERDPTLSFASARETEAEKELGGPAALLRQPNAILAVEYAKAIRTLGLDMELWPLKRRGAKHDAPESAEAGFSSASALREALRRGDWPAAELPGPAAEVFARERAQGRELGDPGALETALLARLRALGEGDFLTLPDAAGGLGGRLYRAVRTEGSVDGIVRSAVGKRYTAARVRRACLAACLGVKDGMAAGAPPYARILAVNASGREYLRRLREVSALPLVTKPASVRELGRESEALFTLGADAHDLYVLGFGPETERRPGADWRTGPAIM